MEARIAAYLEDLAVHNYSARTIKSAGTVLGLFRRWAAERGILRPEEVTPLVLERYQRHLFYYRRPNGKPLSFRTQNTRLTHVRSLFRWLTRQRHLLYNPAAELELPKYNRRLPAQSLSRDEVESVLAQPDCTGPLGLRDRAILETFYSTGIRRMELRGLDIYDLDLDREWMVIRSGKGDKDRVVPIGERALAWVMKYLEDVRPTLVCHAGEPGLFLTDYGERFQPDGMTHRVKRYLRAAGITKKGACHLFRHSMATQMLENGADIRFIQEILGHAKLETTQVYTHVAIHQLKEIHTATHPAAKLERRRDDDDDDDAVDRTDEDR